MTAVSIPPLHDIAEDIAQHAREASAGLSPTRLLGLHVVAEDLQLFFVIVAVARRFCQINPFNDAAKMDDDIGPSATVIFIGRRLFVRTAAVGVATVVDGDLRDAAHFLARR